MANGTGFRVPEGSFSVPGFGGAGPSSAGTQFGGGGFGFGQAPKQSGFSKFATSVPGQLAFEGGGAALDFIGGLFDKSKEEREKILKELGISAEELANMQFDEGAFQEELSFLGEGLKPFQESLARTAFNAAGSQSGFASRFITNQFQPVFAREAGRIFSRGQDRAARFRELGERQRFALGQARVANV